ncbi:Glutathione S-transferase F10 [Dendrobium catenatum]|uniref:glutathione transferase n=1 Tax=Dendrobium catenatum TaxID=906689 RepID=A0A2I0WXH3_9ASPA|nr:Glutathione S-transferase F10 [Dendrobium catenatum]
MVKVIYGKPMLPDLARVLACLNEKEIKFELEDMNKGMRMSQDILNLQISILNVNTFMAPQGGRNLPGSSRHVVEKYKAYGYPYLLGKDPLAKVSVEQWIKSEEHRFNPPSSALVFYLAYNMEADVEKTTQSEKKLEKVLNLYEKRLGESDFLAANYFTLADLYHLPNTYYLQSSVEYGHLFKDRKNVNRWWKSISERKSWKEVVKKFEEEGLQFYVPVTNSEIDKSLSSTRKNGIKFGPFGSSEIGRKMEGVKPATEDRKETPEPTDKDKFSSTENSKSGITDEGKERDANKPIIDANKERAKPDDKDKALLGDKDKSGKTDETKKPYANKPDGDEETHKHDDKDKTSSDDNRKMGVTDKRKESDATKPASEENKEAQKLGDKDKASSGDKDKPVKIDNIKDREADKKDSEGEKIEVNKELKTNDASIEGKKDGFKSGDKDKYSTGNEKERDVTKENDNRGAIDSNNQVKKGSAPDDGKDKTSDNNKIPSSKDEKEKAN